ncbi:glycine receptor subunit alpha-3-like [Tachypleus tridentatus]|uniref:glycine receptor subunit alpha-3-like n=1 Tax=Tachypleus tridentatus TaxID=6853 RepID=UPI003FD21E48
MVYKAVQVMDLHSVRETTMDFKLDFYFVELWKDYRLKIHHHTPFPAVVPEEISKEFWIPESLFENAKSTVTSRLSEYSGQIKIFGDATIAQIAMHRVKVSCAMDLHEYPMDLQVCVLKISMFKTSDNVATPAWPETAKNLPGSFKGVSIIGDIRLPQFELLSVVAKKAVMVWETGNYTYLLPTFTFQRRIAFHICSTYLPSALVVVVSWVSFWLPIDAAPARVTLGVTSLLTLSTQMVQSYTSLPPVSYVKALDIWMFVCILLVFTSLTEYAIAYYIFHNWTSPYRILPCNLHKTKTETKKECIAHLLFCCFLTYLLRLTVETEIDRKTSYQLSR